MAGTLLSQEVEGISFPKLFVPEFVEEAVKFRPDDDDICIITFPKAGTHWISQIVSLLVRHSGITDGTMPRCPLTDRDGTKAVNEMKFKPRIYATHLPLIKKTFNPNARYLVVVRDPRDVCVSNFHHHNNIPLMHTGKEDLLFEDFLNMFINGQVTYGDYFDHVRPWFERRNDPNMLFMLYEDLKVNTVDNVFKIAKFMGPEFEKALQNPAVMESFLEEISFDTMKKKVNPNIGKAFDLNSRVTSDAYRANLATMMKENSVTVDTSKNINFIRKGIIGDWKNHFTSDQSQKFDDYVKKNPKNSEIMELFEQFEE